MNDKPFDGYEELERTKNVLLRVRDILAGETHSHVPCMERVVSARALIDQEIASASNVKLDVGPGAAS